MSPFVAPERISTYGLVNTASDRGPCRKYAVLRSSELIRLMQVCWCRTAKHGSAANVFTFTVYWSSTWFFGDDVCPLQDKASWILDARQCQNVRICAVPTRLQLLTSFPRAERVWIVVSFQVCHVRVLVSTSRRRRGSPVVAWIWTSVEG